MKKLIAIYPILYLSKQYEPGETLPANNQAMVDAWLEAKTAEWRDEGDVLVEDSDTTEQKESDSDSDSTESPETEEVSTAKAILVSAEAGLAGDAVGAEAEENLVGKLPKGVNRNRK